MDNTFVPRRNVIVKSWQQVGVSEKAVVVDPPRTTPWQCEHFQPKLGFQYGHAD